MISNELERLAELYRDGTLTAEEFEAAKRKVLSPSGTGLRDSGEILGMNPQNWCTLMHLSQLLWWLGGLGVAAPVVMWLISRDQSQLADRHGRVIVNWLLSFLVYNVVSLALWFAFIGMGMTAILGVMSFIMPIVGAMRASEGRLWPYPLSIEFFSTAADPRAEQL